MKDWYNRDYFESRIISNYGEYKDWPQFEDRAKFIVKDFAPKSVLDIGCAKGYLVKHLQALGVDAYGVDISDYAVKEGTKEGISNLFSYDVSNGIVGDYDLIVSFDVLEHIAEDKVDALIKEMAAHSKKQFHMITTNEYHFGGDKTHICMKDFNWWLEKFYGTNSVIIHAGQQQDYV